MYILFSNFHWIKTNNINTRISEENLSKCAAKICTVATATLQTVMWSFWDRNALCMQLWGKEYEKPRRGTVAVTWADSVNVSGQNIEDSIGWSSLNWDMPQTRTLKFNGNLLKNNSWANILGYLWTKYSDSKLTSAWAQLFMTWNRIKMIFVCHIAPWRLRQNWRHILLYFQKVKKIEYQILS